MTRFTIRELLLLTLVAAMGVAWWISDKHWRSEWDRLDRRAMGLEIDNDYLRSSHAEVVRLYERDTGQTLSFPLLEPVIVEAAN